MYYKVLSEPIEILLPWKSTPPEDESFPVTDTSLIAYKCWVVTVSDTLRLLLIDSEPWIADEDLTSVYLEE